MLKAILKGSVELCLSNFDDLIKAAGAWTVVMIIAGIVLQMTGITDQDASALMIEQNPGKFITYILISLVISLIASSSIAVAWHRFALLGERPATIHLRFGRPEFRYLLYSLLLGLFVFAIVFALTLLLVVAGGLGGVGATGEAARNVMLIIMIVGMLVCAPFVARAGLMLPAAAVDRPMGLFRALRFGRGYGWAMVFATIVLLIPFFLLDVAVMMLMMTIGSGLPQLLMTIQFVLLKGLEQIIVTILLLSVMTIAYAYARDRESGNTQEPTNE